MTQFKLHPRKLLRAPYVLNGFYSIKKGVRIICDEAFWALWSLRSLVIPDSVTSIGDRAFARCKSLRSIVIPLIGMVSLNAYHLTLFMRMKSCSIRTKAKLFLAEFKV